MAGAVPRMVSAVNRTDGPIDVMFDGQPIVLLAGYKLEEGKPIGAGPGGSVFSNPLPYFAAEIAKRQNPVMGTEDPEDPREFDSLIGILEWDDDISFVKQSDAEERLDRTLLDDEAQTARVIRRRTGGKRKSKGGRRYSDARLKNPGAIRADYND